MPMLDVVGASKTYEPAPTLLRPLIRTAVSVPVPALTDVTLHGDRGEIIGLVGPNGAGKTTLIKLISTLLQPTSGHVTVDGFDASRNSAEVRRRLGLVLENDQGLYVRLSGLQNLELYGRLADLTRRAARERAREMLDLFGLRDRDKLLFGYSAGMKARLSLARALMADPPLVVLDEPTRSLDPVASRDAMRLIHQLADDGRCVLFSNHRLDEVVRVSSRVVAIVGGRVVFSGPPGELGTDGSDAAHALAELLEQEAARA